MNDKMAAEAAAVINSKNASLPSGCWKAGLWCIGIIAVVGFYSGFTSPNGTTSANSTAPNTVTPAATSSKAAPVDNLGALEAKIDALAMEPLDPKYNPEGYAKLGRRAWSLSNELRRWVALSVAQSGMCDRVSTVAIWERSTRADLRWHVGCANGERFIVTETQARIAKAQFDGQTADAKQNSPDTPAPEPMSAVWKGFNENGAVSACEGLIKEAAVNANSFDTSGLPNVQRDEETSQATIYRNFSSENAMGGTISGKYQCVVDASGKGRVLTLKTQDAFGVHVIFDRR